MRAPLELTNQKFGRLTVLKRNPVSYGTRSRWDCICECGKTTTVIGSKLMNNHTRSCGCFHHERFTQSCITHGMRQSDEYNIWCGIKSRCTNPNHDAYDRYGGRGITICDKWKNSFPEFYLDMGERPGPEYSIERKENDKGYEPGNCYWATKTEQANNRRSNVFHTYNGITKTISEWAREYRIPDHVLRKRLYAGWDFEKAIAIPVRKW